MSGLSANQPVELRAKMAVPKSAAGSKITLTAKGTSPEASARTTVSDTLKMAAKATPSPTPTDPGGTSPGDGGTLPPYNFLPPGTIPGVSIPGLPSPTGNAGAAFPQVLPTPSPSPHAQTPARAIRAADVSAGLPLNVRLIGGQLAGLAILAAAIMIVVARLSLRGHRPGRGDDS